jgi:hypothetical protein
MPENGLVALKGKLAEEGTDVLKVLLDGIGVDLYLHLALEVLLVYETALPVQLVDLLSCLRQNLLVFQLN